MNACRDSLAVSESDLETLLQRYQRVRARSLELVAPLSAEDAAVQSMPEASPSKWHLAHTSWFFEQFVLERCVTGYRPLNARWYYLFNSYYQSVGPMHARPHRGLLTRPSLDEVIAYRHAVDARIAELLQRDDSDQLASLITLGLNHEQQHQELLLTDILHLLSCNPLRPAYRDNPSDIAASEPTPLRFVEGAEGLGWLGHAGDGFGFDNEFPRHRVLLRRHALADRLVSNAEYRDFIDDGGYRRAELWLSDGWARVRQDGWQRPLYWNESNTHSFTLDGEQPLSDAAPVSHVSFFEADAYARWAGARLPSEAEWESAAGGQSVRGNFYERGALRPLPARVNADVPAQLFGDCWEWTASPYVGYPGFQPLGGSLGEYNGKFMCGQWVLRGGSCFTPSDHLRASYRNFFYPADRWQCMGIRLAKDL